MSAIFGGSFYLKSSLGPVSESNSSRMAVDLVLLSALPIDVVLSGYVSSNYKNADSHFPIAKYI